jgi:fructokinase
MDEFIECKRLFNSRLDKDAFIHDIMNTYSLDIVSLTNGGKGSELYTRDGCFATCALSAHRIIDSVGAGDAYAAMLAVGIINQWPPIKTLSMASRFASRICEIRGAIPESVSFYDPIKNMMRKI